MCINGSARQRMLPKCRFKTIAAQCLERQAAAARENETRHAKTRQHLSENDDACAKAHCKQNSVSCKDKAHHNVDLHA